MGDYVRYPAILNLEGKGCLVVGGGLVAERKIASLLAAGAMVIVISPGITERLTEWAVEERIQVEHREYQIGDIRSRDVLLVFAASNSPDVNRLVCAEAVSACRLCNSADDLEAGNFIVPASINRGRLQVAVSTSGASPTVAKRLAADIGECFGDEYETYLEFLHQVRMKVLAGSSDPVLRRKLLKEAAEWDVLGVIRDGSFIAWRELTFNSLAQQLVLRDSTSEKE